MLSGWWIGFAWNGSIHSGPVIAQDSYEVAPEFTADENRFWINSEPLKMKDLRGKVVMLDVWTFACWNCYRSLPWVKKVQERFAGSPFQIIGIHSPEFPKEKDVQNVKDAIKEHALTFPNMMDNDFAYWARLKNKYWPTFYLIDKQGRIRHKMIGETHEGTDKALAFEKIVETLLSE